MCDFKPPKMGIQETMAQSLISLHLQSSIHGVFWQNRLYLRHTVVTSFRVKFEKAGRELLREGKRREGD